MNIDNFVNDMKTTLTTRFTVKQMKDMFCKEFTFAHWENETDFKLLNHPLDYFVNIGVYENFADFIKAYPFYLYLDNGNKLDLNQITADKEAFETFKSIQMEIAPNNTLEFGELEQPFIFAYPNCLYGDDQLLHFIPLNKIVGLHSLYTFIDSVLSDYGKIKHITGDDINEYEVLAINFASPHYISIYKAHKLFKANEEVYLIHDDKSEALAETLDQIEDHYRNGGKLSKA